MTQPDALALGAANTVLMVVPMFHANSWGLAFAGERPEQTELPEASANTMLQASADHVVMLHCLPYAVCSAVSLALQYLWSERVWCYLGLVLMVHQSFT